MNWTETIVEQLDWHWHAQLRPRLDGLSDDEYRWDPAPPVPTIAWRLTHITVGVFGDRAARHFGAPAMSYADFEYVRSADEALAQLDRSYADWTAGVRDLTAEQFAGPCGEPGYEQHPYAALVLHINREAIHHGAEVALLRDLYARQRT